MEYTRPTLNDVFLRSTGRNIGEEEEGGFMEKYAMIRNKKLFLLIKIHSDLMIAYCWTVAKAVWSEEVYNVPTRENLSSRNLACMADLKRYLLIMDLVK
ncbi:MAG: hypothetical protein WAM14_01540 [Candidatus Nitrosopolaris sp.]